MGGGESEHPIVRVKQGQPPRATLRREGGAELRNGLEERWQRDRALETSQRDSNG